MAESENEQVEALKEFFKRYGNAILTVLILVLGSYSGYQYWQNSQTTAHETASLYYNQLTQLASVEGKTTAQEEQFSQLFAKLTTDYPESRYSAYAALLNAKIAIDADNLDKAQQSLEWIVTHNSEKDMQALVQLRLARIDLARADYDKALGRLSNKNNAFAPLYEELSGDVYLAQNKKDLALAAYEKAKSLLQSAKQNDSRLLDMKIDALKPTAKGSLVPLNNSEKTP